MQSAEAERNCNTLYALNRRGKRLSWKGRVPIIFSLDADVPESFTPAISNAVATWNKDAGYGLFELESTRRERTVPASDGRNTIYVLGTNARSDDLRSRLLAERKRDGGIAFTTLSGQGNRIIDTDIIFDSAEFPLSTSRIHQGSFDVETVMLHELGHALGLEHNPDSASIMYYGESGFGVSSRTLDAATLSLLDCEYR